MLPKKLNLSPNPQPQFPNYTMPMVAPLGSAQSSLQDYLARTLRAFNPEGESGDDMDSKKDDEDDEDDEDESKEDDDMEVDGVESEEELRCWHCTRRGVECVRPKYVSAVGMIFDLVINCLIGRARVRRAWNALGKRQGVV